MISHTWQIASHARPTFCNVCREALGGVTSHGLSCGVCKLKAHKTCATDVSISCKWTTIETVDKSCLSHENDIAILHHQWLEGNLPVAAKCVVCDKTCGSVLRLQDWRCLWCRATVHDTCRPHYIPHCSLGPTRHATVPPTCLSRNAVTDEWKISDPFPGSPLIVFINSKSGNGHGDRFLIRLKQYLNPSQVFDLSSTGPKKGLQFFRRLSPLRLLVGGGDGSIGWVLKEIDQLCLKAEKVCVSVLPLGTGNDLARVCGWGAAIEADVNIISLLEKYDVGTPRLLDRWSIMSVENHVSDACVEGEEDDDDLRGRKDSIFGATEDVIRDIDQVFSEEFDDRWNFALPNREEVCKCLLEIRHRLDSLKTEEVTEGNGFTLYRSILRDVERAMTEVVQSTEEGNEFYQLATDILSSIPEFTKDLAPTDELQKTKVQKDVENISRQTLKCLKEKLSGKLEEFEILLDNPIYHFDSTDPTAVIFHSARAQDENWSDEQRDEVFQESFSTYTATPDSFRNAEKTSLSSSSDSSEDEEDDDEQKREEEERKEDEDNEDEDEDDDTIISVKKSEDIIARLSPISSPVERSHSLTGHAEKLPVPPAFSDSLLSEKEETFRTDKKLSDVLNTQISAILEPELKVGLTLTQDSPFFPSILISSPDPSPPDISQNDEKTDQTKEEDALLGAAEANLTRSRRSSRFPSNAGLLSSVPEDEQLTSSSSEVIPSRRPSSGSRRLSVGAMVSLSALRGETGNVAPSSGTTSPAPTRIINKTIPIINPLVKTPNWPNIDKNQNRGLISMVVLASADALCAPVTPIMDWTPPPEKMKETSVMNNYFGIGIDAKISLDFHNKREQKPQGHRSRAKNYMWYGMLGSKELLQRTCKNLEKRVILECDGEPIPLPSLQGIVVLNIKSFMGGTNFWGNAKDDNIFLPPNFDDGILEIVAVFSSMHMGASRIVNLQRHRIAQCRSVVIRILGKEGVPVQVDGEAWIHPPGIIRILHKNRVQLVTRDKAMEQQLRSGSCSRAWYREHAHPVLLPFDEEEIQLLRALVAAAKQLLHYLSLLIHALEDQESRDLASLISALQESIATIPVDELPSVEAFELRKRCASFVNNLQNCVASCKKSLVHNLQEETECEVASKLSQSIYSVESLLGKCHEEADLLFFTIRGGDAQDARKSWFKVPRFGRSDGHRRSSVSSLLSGTRTSTLMSTGAGGAGVGSLSFSTGANLSQVKGGSSCLVEVVLQWTPTNVSQWLESIGLPMYCHAFLEHEIYGSELLSLERRDFKDVGVTKVGHIKRLQKGIRDINQGKLPPRLLQNTAALSRK